MDTDSHNADYDRSDYQALGIENRDASLYLSCCGFERCKKACLRPYKRCTDYLIYFILDGQGEFTVNQTVYAVSKGAAFLIYPGTADNAWKAWALTPWTYMWLGFNGTQAPSYLKYAGMTGTSPLLFIHNMEDIALNLTRLLKAKAPTLSDGIKRSGYLYKILSLLITARHSSLSGSMSHEYPSRTYAIYAKNYIEDHFSHTSISQISHLIGIDRSYLHHVFKTNFKISPQEYLMQCRLEHAKKLLLATSCPVKQIASEIGYEDSLQFSKIFKKRFGQSPKGCRAANHNEGND